MEHPYPGADDRGVLSAAFPEELPADLKHRKLGEQGRWAEKWGPSTFTWKLAFESWGSEG